MSSSPVQNSNILGGWKEGAAQIDNLHSPSYLSAHASCVLHYTVRSTAHVSDEPWRLRLSHLTQNDCFRLKASVGKRHHACIVPRQSERCLPRQRC